MTTSPQTANEVHVCQLTLQKETSSPTINFTSNDLFTSGGADKFEIPGKINLAWACSLINAYSCILFCFVLLKLCRVMFSGNKSRNWLTICSYSLIILDMVVGSATITSMIVLPYVYDLEHQAPPGFSIFLIAF